MGELVSVKAAAGLLRFPAHVLASQSIVNTVGVRLVFTLQMRKHIVPVQKDHSNIQLRRIYITSIVYLH